MPTPRKLDVETRTTLARMLEAVEGRLERLRRSQDRAERERDALSRALLS